VCASAGTDYADLSGEVLFIRESIDRCHDVAAGTGTRIVHCCGFDSIPSDLGVLLLHQAARTDGTGDLTGTTLVVTALRDGISAGNPILTVAHCLLSDPVAWFSSSRRLPDPRPSHPAAAFRRVLRRSRPAYGGEEAGALRPIAVHVRTYGSNQRFVAGRVWI
jgi:short subunit dehydrogenase-like uncharacterized protein